MITRRNRHSRPNLFWWQDYYYRTAEIATYDMYHYCRNVLIERGSRDATSST